MTGVVVAGQASAEEVAAVTAVLAARAMDVRPASAYERWRVARVASLSASLSASRRRPRG